MFITLCVIAYNEESNIEHILNDINNQDYDHNNIELLMVDGDSTDRTKEIMNSFAAAHKDSFRRVLVLDNPKKILPAGWNVALREYKGEAILKVDAHAAIPEDFVSKNVAVLESGECICGGLRPNIIDESTPFKETLLLAESSMFGSSIAPYRNNPGRTYVNSVFHGAYRREVFDKVGFFNEDLVRTEDNEIHYRMRKAGFKIAFDPDIISYQHTRSSLAKMLKQKYSNGYWIGLTAGVCPGCLSLYHFVPFAFVSAIAMSATGTALCLGLKKLLGGVSDKAVVILEKLKSVIVILTVIMWLLYGLLAGTMSIMSTIKAGKKRNVTCLMLPFIFLLLHISYGIGTVVGLIKMPAWLKGIKRENERNKER